MLIDEIKDHLLNCIIPFWENLKDEEHGGFYGYVDFDLNILKESPKGAILNSRILWFFSNAYSVLGDFSLLDYADHGYKFMVNNFFDDENGGLYWSLNYDKKVLDDTKHSYNQAFGIYALSSYYIATNNEEALKKALEIFEILETKYKDSAGYEEAFDRNFNRIDNLKLSENGVIAQKTMNTLLHILEAYTELYKASNLKKVKDAILNILDIFLNKVYNSEKNRLEVFFNENMNSILDLHSFGHDIEASWLIDKACDVIGENKHPIKKVTSEIVEEIFNRLEKDGSLTNECENGITDNTRVWWVQAEALVGFLNAYEKNKEKLNYKRAVLNLWNYIKNYLIDNRPYSEWFWEIDNNGVENKNKPFVEEWKCPYHNGRMCFEVIRRGVDVS